MTTALATERPSASWSSRWWLIRPASRAGTVSAITTSGSRSSAACAMPLTALASPGPRVTTTAPGAPVRSAQVAAMIVAAVSPCGEDEPQPGLGRGPDHVQIRAAARYPEQQPGPGPGQRPGDGGRDGLGRRRRLGGRAPQQVAAHRGKTALSKSLLRLVARCSRRPYCGLPVRSVKAVFRRWHGARHRPPRRGRSKSLGVHVREEHAVDIVPGGRPLDGVLVVALEQAVAAPFATRQLADLGARVIKIERPGRGDFARDYDSAAGDGFSSWFVWLNRSKESVVLDLKTDPGGRRSTRSSPGADVFVCNLAPAAIRRLGLEPGQLVGRHPRLVACQLSGYGEEGPYAERKAYDLLVQAEAGVLAVTGSAEAPGKGRHQRRRHRRRHVCLQRHPVRSAAARADRPRRHRQGVAVRCPRRMDVVSLAAGQAHRQAHRRAPARGTRPSSRTAAT